MELIMQCQATSALSTYLDEEDRVYNEEKRLYALADEKAKELLKVKPEAGKVNQIMNSVYDNAYFELEFDKILYEVTNKPTAKSAKKLQKFMYESAFELALKQVRKSNEN